MIRLPFIETSTSKLIHQRLNIALKTRENVALTGAAGVGKTVALREYVANCAYGGAHFFPVTRALGRAPGTLYEEIAEAVGTHRGLNPASTLKAIRKRLHDIFFDIEFPCLLVFDEAQNINLDTVRDLLTLTEEDDVFVTIVFSGNPDVLKVVNTAVAKFKSMGRRATLQADIQGVTHEDADLFADAFEVRDAACRRVLRAISEKDHVSGVVTILKIAREFAETKPIALEHLHSAIEILPQFRYAITKR